MAADRRQRRPKLVRDRHQEVALELLRLLEPRSHLPEALRELADLTARVDLGNLVQAAGDVVGRLRELLDGLRDSTDRYQASAPATTIPKKPASVSRSISVVHRSRSSAFGFAATSAP